MFLYRFTHDCYSPEGIDETRDVWFKAIKGAKAHARRFIQEVDDGTDDFTVEIERIRLAKLPVKELAVRLLNYWQFSTDSQVVWTRQIKRKREQPD